MIYVLVIAVCVVLNGCLSAFEMGLVTVKRSSLKLLIENGSKSAIPILNMRQRLEHTLSIVQVGITVVAIISGAMMGWISTDWGRGLFYRLGIPSDWAEMVSVVVFTLIVTYFTVVFGELVPKSIATRYPSRTVFFLAPAFTVLNYFFSPLPANVYYECLPRCNQK